MSPARGLARLDALTALAREHGWLVEQRPSEPPLPEGVVESIGWGAIRRLDDGRDWTFVVVYGKPDDGRGWQALKVMGKWPVVGTLDDPTCEAVMGPDLTRYWRALSDLEWWLPRFDDLVQLYRDEGVWPERRTLSERVVDSVKRATS